jgi:hypothetical protein
MPPRNGKPVAPRDDRLSTKTTHRDHHDTAGCAHQSSGSTEPGRCHRCGRRIWSPRSVRFGLGPICRQHIAFEAELCRVLDGYAVQVAS